MRAALAAAACTALVGIPALARAQQSTGSIEAHDAGYSGTWDANGTGTSTLTVAPGATVTFSYPSGASLHNVVFRDAQPASCSGLPPADQPRGPGWSGTCTFDHAGTYAFVCGLHPDMTGEVVVPAAATPTVPGATPTPAPPSAAVTPTPTPSPQSTLKVTLPPRQAGTHVRGSVAVQSAHTRLEVTASAALRRGRAERVGGWLRRSAPAGRVAFSVPLDARARKALRRRHRLAVTLRVALVPPGGRALNRRAKTTVRSG
jgi:plastocyanin